MKIHLNFVIRKFFKRFFKALEVFFYFTILSQIIIYNLFALLQHFIKMSEDTASSRGTTPKAVQAELFTYGNSYSSSVLQRDLTKIDCNLFLLTQGRKAVQ